MDLENLDPISPLAFFQIEASAARGKKPKALPTASELLSEESFAHVAMSWDEAGLYFRIDVDQPFQEITYPDVTRGDSVELFIDTRDFKEAKSLTRYCHHFLFLPVVSEGLAAEEITRLRSIDKRPLADPSLLHVETTHKKKSYHMDIFIDAEALLGFEGARKVGFNYRINRYRGASQHFAASSREFGIETHPGLWASINLEG